jgi:hypothetical protein
VDRVSCVDENIFRTWKREPSSQVFTELEAKFEVEKMRNSFIVTILMTILVVDSGCSRTIGKPTEDPVASFKQKVGDFVNTYKQSKHEEVFHIDRFEDVVAEGWRKGSSELVPDSYLVDVEKTDSLVSPYIGTLKFDTKMFVSNLQDSEKGARETQIFTNTNHPYVHNHLHTYSYQDGAWVVKSRKQRSQDIDEDTWKDCKDGE